jgi:hypothetical protein
MISTVENGMQTCLPFETSFCIAMGLWGRMLAERFVSDKSAGKPAGSRQSLRQKEVHLE